MVWSALFQGLGATSVNRTDKKRLSLWTYYSYLFLKKVLPDPLSPPARSSLLVHDRCDLHTIYFQFPCIRLQVLQSQGLCLFYSPLLSAE